MWQHRTPGIPDELFDRVEDVPITKEEVRVIQVSKARLSSGQIVYDVGCGSGSISVEAAHQVGSSGKIFSIDIDPNAVELTKKNLAKFQISNVTVILGNATQKIDDLPMADAIFIGGTGGETADIVKLCESKLKQGGRIVIGTILVETLYSVLSIIEKLKFSSVDVIQVTISKSKKTSTGTMFLARNPVTIISATKI
jgi:cobalt-precorrin-6B (C15)-methyltransferase